MKLVRGKQVDHDPRDWRTVLKLVHPDCGNLVSLNFDPLTPHRNPGIGKVDNDPRRRINLLNFRGDWTARRNLEG